MARLRGDLVADLPVDKRIAAYLCELFQGSLNHRVQRKPHSGHGDCHYSSATRSKPEFPRFMTNLRAK